MPSLHAFAGRQSSTRFTSASPFFSRPAGIFFAPDVLAESAEVVHLIGCEFRFAPGQALLARVVRSGAVGEARLATFLLHIPLLADPDLPRKLTTGTT